MKRYIIAGLVQFFCIATLDYFGADKLFTGVLSANAFYVCLDVFDNVNSRKKIKLGDSHTGTMEINLNPDYRVIVKKK